LTGKFSPWPSSRRRPILPRSSSTAHLPRPTVRSSAYRRSPCSVTGSTSTAFALDSGAATVRSPESRAQSGRGLASTSHGSCADTPRRAPSHRDRGAMSGAASTPWVNRFLASAISLCESGHPACPLDRPRAARDASIAEAPSLPAGAWRPRRSLLRAPASAFHFRRFAWPADASSFYGNKCQGGLLMGAPVGEPARRGPHRYNARPSPRRSQHGHDRVLHGLKLSPQGPRSRASDHRQVLRQGRRRSEKRKDGVLRGHHRGRSDLLQARQRGMARHREGAQRDRKAAFAVTVRCGRASIGPGSRDDLLHRVRPARGDEGSARGLGLD